MGLGTGATLAYGRSAPSSASGVREYVPDERHRSAIGGNHAYGKLGHAAGKPLTMHDAQPRRAAPPMSLALPPRSSRNTLEFLGPASTDGLWSERTHDDPQPLSPRSSMPPGLRPRTASLSLPHPHLPPKPRGPLESVPSPDVVPYATSSSTPQRVSPGVSRMQHQEDDIILPLPMPAPIVSAPLPPPTAPFGMMSGSRNLMPSMHNHHGLSPRSGFVSSPSLVRDASSPQHLPSLFGSVADIWGHPSGVMTTTAAATTTTTAAAAAMTATPTSVGVTANNSSLNARPVLSPRTDADQEQAEHGPSHANSIISRVMDLVEPTMGDCGHTSLAAGAMGSGAPDDSSSCSSSSSSPPSPALGHYQPSPAVEAAIVTSMKSPPSATLPAPRTPRLSMSVSRLANGFVPAIPPAIPPPEEDIVSVSYFWNLEALPLTLPNATVDGVVSAVRRLCNPVQTVKGKRRMAPELDFVAFANFARAADFLPGEVEGDAERELEHADVTMIHTPSGAGAPFVAWVARFLQMHPGRHRIVLLTTAFAGESAARVNRWSTQHGQEIVLLCDSGTADESRLRFPLAALVQASAI
ncbi:hypothetical protein CXG81DRAFT_25304 [Caulochytrium protostelioides]|uniref:Uncharacterized protein n=1 Tax=Caulochytrium protostelioides TaxID=1555241 RepID=A0A4P9XA76_9FUNG|nr:hypothetical protein CXG81DRAFT_25304 [Caulochytrium protostelioides]|eukprot:RKP02010.1 hypothetical protein CXG81DRAFT_25304 [Caulochytrium protostelioides]